MELGKVIRGLPERCRASNLPRLPKVFGSSPRGSSALNVAFETIGKSE